MTSSTTVIRDIKPSVHACKLGMGLITSPVSADNVASHCNRPCSGASPHSIPRGPLGHCIDDTGSKSTLAVHARRASAQVQDDVHTDVQVPPMPHRARHAKRLDQFSRQQAILACKPWKGEDHGTRLDHLEMALEKRWYDCSNFRRRSSSDRSALVSGCIETTAGVENEGQAVKPAC